MISTPQIEKILTIFKPYNPKKIGIFGSYSRGENSMESDVDILYDFVEPISLFEKFEIQDLLQKELDLSVDLVSEKYLHPILKEQIFQDLKIIYDK